MVKVVEIPPKTRGSNLTSGNRSKGYTKFPKGTSVKEKKLRAKEFLEREVEVVEYFNSTDDIEELRK